jgi:hypothetical protein
MKPLNHIARKEAILRFIGIYTLSLAVPVVASYFLFYKPNAAIKEENRKLKATVVEQNLLLQRMDTLRSQLTLLHEKDKQISDSLSNQLLVAEISRQSDEIENSMKLMIYRTKADSLSYTYGIGKSLSKNIISAFESFITYRNTIAILRKMIASQGGDNVDLLTLRTENKTLRDENMMLKLMSGGNNRGGGGGGSTGFDKSAIQLGDCMEKLRVAERDLSLWKEKADLLTKQLASLNLNSSSTVSVVNYDKTKELEISLITYIADKMNNCRDRLNYYQTAKEKLQEILANGSTQDVKVKAQQKLVALNTRIKEQYGCD